MTEYCLFTLPLSLIIIEGFRPRKANIGNSTLQTKHSEGIFLEIKLFLTYSLKQLLFKLCTQQKRSSDFILKTCQYFCSKRHYGHYKTRVSRHSGCWLLLPVISNIVGPGFSSTSFASRVHLCPEMKAEEIQCTS